MINPTLHKQAVPLDRERDRQLRLNAKEMDWSIAADLNALFALAAEFADISREYPILFVSAGSDDKGQATVAPVAAFGLRPGENLFLQGSRWRGQYIPALLRVYPFSLGRLEDGSARVLCIDRAWKGLSDSEGMALFGEDGTPGDHLVTMNRQLEAIETEVQRTHALCRVLLDKGLLREMRFDAELPDGSKLQADGFLAVDEDKLGKLADDDVLQLYRNGVLGLIHAHQISLGNMRKLVNWRLEREAAPA